MGEKVVIGPITKGLRLDREAFVIDNDSFPALVNAYTWRGRVKRKRGTRLLNRLNRFFDSTSTIYSASPTFNLDSSGNGNLVSQFSLGANASIKPGTVIINDSTQHMSYTDPASDGILVGSPSGSGTINYSSGAFNIVGAAGDAVSTNFFYYPDLPVMGLRTFRPTKQAGTYANQVENFPLSVGFDTTFSYAISNTIVAGGMNSIYDVSFYKNPATSISSVYTNYVQKSQSTPLTWNGQNYQQFWTTNFQGAMWATNGVPGMQFEPTANIVSLTVNTPNQVTVVLTAPGPAEVGDFVFFNEWVNTTQTTPNIPDQDTLNFQTGYLITGSTSTSYVIYLPNASVAASVTTYTPGILQYLTTRKTTTVDGIRWYDGDPTNGGTYPPAGNAGWVNYAPPLNYGPNWSIANSPQATKTWYLAGATMIYPFRDFLLFVGPWIQQSTGSAIWLQDTIIFAQNGTPFYTCSFTQSVPLYGPLISYHPILVPGANSATALSQYTATPNATWEDISGFGGYISSGIAQPIWTLVPNEDVLILGYPQAFTRLIYTGNNLIPFLFYRINTELGTSSTFSAITFDKGSFTIGQFGFALTTQVSSQRTDLEIPDNSFEVNYANNGNMRICAGRNFYDEWVYITYSSNSNPWIFPNQTLMYNYRDESWAIHNESYTTYGEWTFVGGLTWAAEIRTWGEDDDSWNADPATVGAPNLIAGNQQGFVLQRDVGTGEGFSLYVQNIDTTTGIVTSPFHNMNFSDPESGALDYVVFSNVTSVTGETVKDQFGNNINGNIYQVQVIDQNTFRTFPLINTGTYLGGGVMKRAYVPFIQSKQFPIAWSGMRKTILGNQSYLFSRTANAQITLNLYLSMDSDNPYNNPTDNNAIIYSQILYTCPESTNLGLVPSNTNLQELNQIDSFGRSSNSQAQIWHRMNTSLIGDTVQFGFTLSTDQMLSSVQVTQFVITGATKANPCVLTCTAPFGVGDDILITGVEGMTELNNNAYTVTANSGTTITINTDSSDFGVYTNAGTAQEVIENNQFAEIEFHGAILDTKPGPLLA